MELWLGAINFGFLYALLAIGSFITFRILNFSDITVDGSFTLGAAVSAIMVVAGINPYIALAAAFFAGGVAGALTGIIHTKLKIDGLLAGILVMIGLYSINLHIMGKSNVPLLNKESFVTPLNSFNPGMNPEIWLAICLVVIFAFIWLGITLFLRTDFGLTIRSTGNNPQMTSASGINVDSMKIFGVALSNGFVGLAGALVAQYQGFADIGMGIGALIIGLASVIIGEAVLRTKAISLMVLAAIIGSIIYRFMIAFALSVGMNPLDLKLLTALFVLATLIITKLTSKSASKKPLAHRLKSSMFVNKKFYITIGVIAAICVLGYIVINKSMQPSKFVKIGIVRLSDSEIYLETIKGFELEMKERGYINGENCEFLYESANGEITNVNAIIDKFITQNVDLIMTISTPCTQAAIHKTKSIPVVFATVANPFIIGAGESDSVHQGNVTGVYGWVPMERFSNIVDLFLQDNAKIGVLWNPAFANSEYNVNALKEALKTDTTLIFEGVTISGTADVYHAAQSLVQKGIKAFVLPPDDNVYNSMESIIKVANAAKIPVFTTDIQKLGNGVMCAFGYDYRQSGKQAAGIINRIINGEKVEEIHFEKYNVIELGVDVSVAKALNYTIPDAIKPDITKISGVEPVQTPKRYKIGIVQFGVEPNVEICKNGIIQALNYHGYFDGNNIEIIYKNANGDMAMINSIVQGLVQSNVDYIVPLSTPVVQSAVQFAASIGHKVVFTYIYNPYGIGAAKTPYEHNPNLTGIACFPPIEDMLDLIIEMFPDRKSVGVVWNTAESNSESVVLKLRAYAEKKGVEIIEATITTSAEILQASQSLVQRGAKVFLNTGDNTLNVGFDSFLKVANSAKIPVFSIDADFAYTGALVGFGPNYYTTGYEGGEYLVRALQGENIDTIPIKQTTETTFFFNKKVQDNFGFNINPEIIKRASKVINN
jgi:putative ABC transport system permease protein